MPEVASRVVADLGASDLALDAFSSGTSAHLRVCGTGAPETPRGRSTGVRIRA